MGRSKVVPPRPVEVEVSTKRTNSLILPVVALLLFSSSLLLLSSGGALAVIKFSVPYYKTGSQISASSNLFNNGTQVGIGSDLHNFGNRNPLNLNKSKNGVLTIDGDIKLSKIRKPPTEREDRLYNLNGDLWWNQIKIGLWTKVNPPPSYATSLPDIIYLGNIGIGTDQPLAKLHVVSASSTMSNITNYHTALFQAPDQGPNESAIHYGDTGDWLIRSASSNGKVIIQDNGGGRIGVGTDEPKTKLHVRSNFLMNNFPFANYGSALENDNVLFEDNQVNLLDMLAYGTTGEHGSYVQFLNPNNNFARAYMGYRNGDKAIVFGHGILNNSASEKLRIAENGNVGIGMAAPTEKLAVNGNIKTSGEIQAKTVRLLHDYRSEIAAIGRDGDIIPAGAPWPASANAGAVILKYGEGVGSFFYIRNQGAGNKLAIGSGNGDKFTMDSSGSINISGTVKIDGETTYAVDGYPGYSLSATHKALYNHLTAGASHCPCGSSDIRLKQNICKLDNALDKVMELNGIKFNWRTKEFPDRYFPDGKQIGFIAQEVEKVLPELVGTDDKGYKTVNYDGVTAVLVNALKEQQQQFDSYKKEQQQQIDELRSEIEKLKAGQ